MLKKSFGLTIAILLVMQLIMPVSAQAADFTPNPQTSYATSFISACDGQQWFINEVERILNENQKTLNTITSSADLDIIKTIGLKGHKITGQIPSAIGDLKELRFLLLSNNQLSGIIPASLYTLPKLQNMDISNNNYSGAIPSEFGIMPALIHLSLRGNQYTGSVPNVIKLSYFWHRN